MPAFTRYPGPVNPVLSIWRVGDNIDMIAFDRDRIVTKEAALVRGLVCFMTLTLAACGTTIQQERIDNQKNITDFSNRAVVYAWFDDSGFFTGDLTSFKMERQDGAQDSPQYSMAWERIHSWEPGSGYLFWHAGFEPGIYRFHSMGGQHKDLAGRRVWTTLTFPPLTGLTAVRGPGVVFAGCYAMERTSGVFERSTTYRTRVSACGLSRREMQEKLLEHASEFGDPLPAQRIREAMH